MIYEDFKILCDVDDLDVDIINSIVFDKYIECYILKQDDINKTVLVEKVLDFIDKVIIKENSNPTKLFKEYIKKWDKLIYNSLGNVIDGKNSKGKDNIVPSRAKKYYDLAKTRINESMNTTTIEDFARIAICLYNSKINNKGKTINDIDLSISNVDIYLIQSTLENETKKIVFKMKKDLFHLNKQYSNDLFFMVMTIMIYYHLKSKEIRGEF